MIYSRVQTGKFLAQVFLRQKTCASYVHTMQVFCSRKWLYALEKSDLQSIVQSVAEFHDRNLPKLEHVLFWPVSGASFLYQVFWCKKLATDTCAKNLPF